MSKMVRLEFIAELRGEVNGQPIHVEGEGSIVQELGVTAGTYFVRRLPEDFDPKLLAGCLVTGYPSACSHSHEITNPFGLSDYKYERALHIPGRGNLVLAVDCKYEGGRLVSRFSLNGTVDVRNIGIVEPITETWQRSTDHSIAAKFDMNWGGDIGPEIQVKTSSEYHIQDPLPIPDRVTRLIEVTPRMLGDGVFTLFQVSSIQ